MGATRLDGGFIDLREIPIPPNPALDVGRLYVRDDGGTTTLFFLDSAGTETDLLAGGGGGEANTSSNVGTGEGLALAKVVVDLPFKSLIGEASRIILTGNANDVTFTIGTDIVTLGDTQTLVAKTLTTPTIASYVNATHDHLAAAGGGLITAAAISDFDTAVDANANVTANTAKVTNATHTGDVTGSVGLTIAPNIIVNSMINATAAILFNKMVALTINRALITDGSGFIIVSAVTNTELALLSGATTLELQANKGAVSGYAGLNGSQELTNDLALISQLPSLTINRALITDGSGVIIVSAVTNTELALLDGATTLELQANKGAVSGYAGLDSSSLLLLTNFPSGTGLQVLRRNTGNTALEFATLAGGGDMVLADIQIVTGLKTFDDTRFGLRNVADDFTAFFTNTITATRTYILPDFAGTVLISGNTQIVDADINAGASISQSKLNLAITNAELSGSAGITFANMQNIATARLLGRETAASGVIEEISLNSTLELVATTTLQRAALTGDVTATAGSNTTVVANVPAGAYAALSIVNGDISASAAIVLTKLQDIATARLLGRQTAASGAIEEISLDATLELVATTTLRRAAITGDITIAVGSNAAVFGVGVIVDADISATAEINVTKLLDGTPGQFIRTDSAGTGVEWTDDIFTINFIIDGGGSAITTGIKGQVVVDFDCEVIEWAIIGLPAGAIVVDVSKSTFAGFPTMTTLSATEKPTITATNDTGEDRTLTTWTALVAGDIIEFEVDSVATIERCTVALKCRKTG